MRSGANISPRPRAASAATPKRRRTPFPSPAAARSSRPSGRSTARTSRRTRRRGSGAGPRPISSARCAKAIGPTARTISPPFPTPRSRRSSTAICATCGPSCVPCRRAPVQTSSTTCVFLSAGASWSRSGSGSSSLPALSRISRGSRTSPTAAPIWCRPSAIAASATRRAISSAGRRRAASSPAAKGPTARMLRISPRLGSKSRATRTCNTF